MIAGLFDGERVRLEEVHRFPNGPVPVAGTLRWDLPRLWSEALDGLRSAAVRFSDQVSSVGVDTWGVDGVLLSRSGELLGLPFHYRDPRTRGLVERACETVPRAEIFAGSGVQFMPINSLYQLLAWRERSPEILGVADRFLMMPDWFHRNLCGSGAVEFTNATTTQLLSPRSSDEQRAGDWNDDLIAAFDLPRKIFPEIVRPGTDLGGLTHDAAEETGLGLDVRVIAPATHDTGSAVAAVPVGAAGDVKTGEPGWAYISSGTWSLVGVEVPAAVLSEDALAANVTNEGGVAGTYRLLKNVMGLWLVQGVRAGFARGGTDLDYEELTRRAAAAPPFRSLIDPDDPRFLAPANMSAEIAAFCRETDQPEPDSVGAFARCCLESLALKYRAVLGTIDRLTGHPTRVVHVVGRRLPERGAQPVHRRRAGRAGRRRPRGGDRAGQRAGPGDERRGTGRAGGPAGGRAGLRGDHGPRTGRPRPVGAGLGAVRGIGGEPAFAVTLR